MPRVLPATCNHSLSAPPTPSAPSLPPSSCVASCFMMTCSRSIACPASRLVTCAASCACHRNRRQLWSSSDAKQRCFVPDLVWRVTHCRYGAEETESYFSTATMGGMSADPCIFIQSSVNISDIEERSRGRWRIHSKLGNGYVGQSRRENRFNTLNQVQHKVYTPSSPSLATAVSTRFLSSTVA
jgi:hypothetical protein